MIFTNKRMPLLNRPTIVLIILWSHISSSVLTSEINDQALGRENATANSQDQQVSSQYYRPYYNNRRPAYNYNQRPSYPSNYRPTYGNNQRPTYNSVAYSPNNYRPTTRRPNVSNNNYCTSSTPIDSNQGNWICWDQSNQRLRMGSSLTIEKFVIFYSQLADGPVGLNTEFREQICEQSKRFNNVGIICVEYRNHEEGFSNCPSSRNFPEICTADSDVCVCVTDQYSNIASQNMSPGLSSFFSPSVISSNTITASNLNQFFPSWMLPYINTQYLLP